jgi:hypothetical protein
MFLSTAGSCFGRFIGLLLLFLGMRLCAFDQISERMGEIPESRGEMVSNIPDAPTLAPFGTAALLVELLRSTAGNCFGRFIGLLPFRLVGFEGPFRGQFRDHFLIKTLP